MDHRKEQRGGLRDEPPPPGDTIVLDEGRDPRMMVPGAIVLTGDADVPSVAQVVDVVDEPAGRIVHLRLLPGRLRDYEELVARATSGS